MKPSEIIRASKNVMFERGWNQGGYMGPDGSVCVRGALRIAAFGEICPDVLVDADYRLLDRAERYIRLSVPGRNIAGWNDTPGRTFSEVIDVLDLAEKRAMIAEEQDDQHQA
jgi:hypothetical protein